MVALGSAHLIACMAGVGLGVIGFAPLLLVVELARTGRIHPTIGKGMAALAVSFVFLMLSLTMVWSIAPRVILAVIVGVLIGFLAMWAVLAVRSMSR